MKKRTAAALAIGGLGIILIAFYFWVPESEIEGGISESEPGGDRTNGGLSQSIPPSNAHDGCASCPKIQAVDMEIMKRSRPKLSAYSAYIEAREFAMDQYGECLELLREAAATGVPNPDVSHLGGCGGSTPLHVARTKEEIQALLDAGADINARDQYGHTPLHRQGVAGVMVATSENLSIVNMLLEKGADVTVEDDRGNRAWQYAQQMDLSADQYLRTYERVASDAAAQDLSFEEYIAANPRRQIQIERWEKKVLVAAQIRRVLTSAAARR